MSSQRESLISFKTKPDLIWFPIGCKKKVLLETHWAFPLTQHLNSYWLIKKKVWFGIIQGCPSHLTLIHAPFVKVFQGLSFNLLVHWFNVMKIKKTKHLLKNLILCNLLHTFVLDLFFPQLGGWLVGRDPNWKIPIRFVFKFLKPSIILLIFSSQICFFFI